MTEKRPQIQGLSLPAGGGASGVQESVAANAVTGALTLTIPLDLVDWEGFSPDLSLNYASGNGNSPYGLGFDLGPDGIRRKTSAAIPRYDDSDVLLSDRYGELVWDGQPPVAADGFSVDTWAPRQQGEFPLLQRWTETATGISHWTVTNGDNITTTYGRSEQARIAVPGHPERILAWLPEDSLHPSGRRITYAYKREDGSGLPDDDGHVYGPQLYLKTVSWGNYQDKSGEESFAFQLVVDYGEHRLDNLEQPNCDPYAQAWPWPARSDVFSNFRPGFELRTARLARSILAFHLLPDEIGPSPCLCAALALDYDPMAPLAQISSLCRSGFRRHADGSYSRASLPPLTMRYSPFAPAPLSGFDRLRINGGDVVAPLANGSFQMVDLAGEGLPGLLYCGGGAVAYYPPQGDGCFSGPAGPETFPAGARMDQPGLELADIDGDGLYELVVSRPDLNGFYARSRDGGWRPFAAFPSSALGISTQAGERVDLSGAGTSDLLVVDTDRVIYLRGLGADGFAAPVTMERAAGFPAADQQAPWQWVGFADMFGDGLQHRVVVSDGRVEVWPNLGYGAFAQPVLVNGAPRLDELITPSRILFADIDGTGTADLAIAYPDRVDIHFNRGGLALTPPLTIPLPAPLTDNDSLQFADIDGLGVPALIFSVIGASVCHQVFRFANRPPADADAGYAAKPHLLVAIDNGLGGSTQVRFASSVQYWLADRAAGRPWRTRLPMPVPVVARMVETDAVTGSSEVRTWSYRHGCWNAAESALAGFGMVEECDTELRAEPPPPRQLVAAAQVAMPTLTRSWYHPGIQLNDTVGDMWRDEYWAGDSQAGAPADCRVDATAITEESRRQALWALHGSLLRQEVYALDGDMPGTPCTVSQASYQVAMLLPPAAGRLGVFLTSRRESVHWDYDGQANDPRVLHDFILALSAYGAPLEVARLHYPRRPQPVDTSYVYPEQTDMVATLNQLCRIDATQGMRWLGVVCQQQSYELAGLAAPAAPLMTWEEMATQSATALQSPLQWGQPFTGPGVQARLFEWQRTYFWDDALTEALPLCQIAASGLHHHQQQAEFPTAYVAEVFGQRVDDDDLSRNGGYVLDQGHWWACGQVNHYDPAPGHFHALIRTSNDLVAADADEGLQCRTDFTWDWPYGLAQIQVQRWIDATTALTTTVDVDYQQMEPWQLTDANGVVEQVAFDPLGRVLATSIFKPATATTSRQGDGDLGDWTPPAGTELGDVLGDNRAAYLGLATEAFFYDLAATPPAVARIARQTHVSDLSPGQTPVIEALVHYYDGQGRLVERKQATEGGTAIRANRDGIAEVVAPTRWLTSGWTVYNSKGAIAAQYLPFYSDSWAYQPQQAVATRPGEPPPTVHFYDAIGREIRTVFPDGSVSRVQYNPWSEARWDRNDTLLDAPLYLDFVHNYPPNPDPDQQERMAILVAACRCWDTPQVTSFDSTGMSARVMADNLGALTVDNLDAIVAGTPITALALWQDLLRRSYLRPATAPAPADATMVGPAFQPYVAGFALTLDPDHQRFADAVLTLLRPGRLTTRRRSDILGRSTEILDPRLLATALIDPDTGANMRQRYAMAAPHPLASDSVDCGSHWALHATLGFPVRAWDGRGFAVAQAYDRMGRPLQTWVTAPQTTTAILAEILTWGENVADAAANNLWGRLYQERDQAGLVTHGSYDLKGEVLLSTRQLLADRRQTNVDWSTPPVLEDHAYSTALSRDVQGRVLSHRADDGSLGTTAYSLSGRLDTVTAQTTAAAPVTIVAACGWTSDDQPADVTYGNGAASTHDYEADTRRLAAIVTQGSQTAVQWVQYRYDPQGNLTRVHDRTAQGVFTRPSQPEAVGMMAYDLLYRLTAASGLSAPAIDAATEGQGFKQSAFAPLSPAPGQEVTLGNYRENYAFDDGDNLIRRDYVGPTHQYSLATPVAATSNRLAETGYDANGNMTQLDFGAGFTLSWDWGNRLTGADGSTATVVQVHDSSGSVVRQVTIAEGGETECIFLPGYRVERRRSGDTVVAEIHTLDLDGPSGLAALHRSTVGGDTQVRWQLSDDIHSISVELDAAGAPLTYEGFFPFGASTVMAGIDQDTAAVKNRRFSGKTADDTTGLYDFGLRHYAPWLGRWLKADPDGLADGTNMYAYVGDNPLTFHDPNGKGRYQRPRPKKRSSHRRRDLDPSAGKKWVKVDPKIFAEYIQSTYENEMARRKSITPSSVGTIPDLSGKYVEAQYDSTTKTATYYWSKSALKSKFVHNTDKSLYLYIKQEIRKKYMFANLSLGAGLTAFTSVAAKAKTASPDWISANWDKSKHGKSPPRSAKGRIQVREALDKMYGPQLPLFHTGGSRKGKLRSSTAISTPYTDVKGRGLVYALRQDVDEFIARNQGGTTVKTNSTINNQGGINSWVNSTAGSSDKGLIATGGSHQPIKQFYVVFV